MVLPVVVIWLSRRPTTGVIAGHSRPKDGVASLAYDPAIQERVRRTQS
jgi:hypothetical protein